MFKRRMSKLVKAIPADGGAPPPGILIELTEHIRDQSDIIGFEEQAGQIEAWLIPSSEEGYTFRAIGIVGRCGCGKTALAQKVFASPRIQQEFSPRIWVCLSERRLDGELARCDVSVENSKQKEIEHLPELTRKRYLVVLDVPRPFPRDSLTGESVFKDLPKGSGGAVIVTCRREDFVKRMVDDAKHVIRMEPHLSDEICWQIFSKVVRLQGKMDPTDPRLSTIENYVKTKSQGLALAATTLATILPNLLIKWSYHWMRARDLEITWGDDTRYWEWTNLPPPEEMEDVAELVEVCWLSIKGTLELDNLLFEQSYSAYLVFKLKEHRKYLDVAMTARVSIVSKGKEVICKEEMSVFIDRNGEGGPLPQAGGTGWMEIKLGEFFTDKGRWVEALLIENQDLNWKSGLIVKGINFRLN